MSDDLESKLDGLFSEKARRNAAAEQSRAEEEQLRREFADSFEQLIVTVIKPSIDRIAAYLVRHSIESIRTDKTENRNRIIGVEFKRVGVQHGSRAEVFYTADSWSKKVVVRWCPHGLPNEGTWVNRDIDVADITQESVTAKLMDVIDRQSF